MLNQGRTRHHAAIHPRDWNAETDYFVNCYTTWGELMFRLKACAEGKAPGPLFLRNAMAYERRIFRALLL